MRLSCRPVTSYAPAARRSLRQSPKTRSPAPPFSASMAAAAAVAPECAADTAGSLQASAGADAPTAAPPLVLRFLFANERARLEMEVPETCTVPELKARLLAAWPEDLERTPWRERGGEGGRGRESPPASCCTRLLSRQAPHAPPPPAALPPPPSRERSGIHGADAALGIRQVLCGHVVAIAAASVFVSYAHSRHGDARGGACAAAAIQQRRGGRVLRGELASMHARAGGGFCWRDDHNFKGPITSPRGAHYYYTLPM